MKVELSKGFVEKLSAKITRDLLKVVNGNVRHDEVFTYKPMDIGNNNLECATNNKQFRDVVISWTPYYRD